MFLLWQGWCWHCCWQHPGSCARFYLWASEGHVCFIEYVVLGALHSSDTSAGLSTAVLQGMHLLLMPSKEWQDPACFETLSNTCPIPPVAKREFRVLLHWIMGIRPCHEAWMCGSSSLPLQGRFRSWPGCHYVGSSTKPTYNTGQMQTIFRAPWPLTNGTMLCQISIAHA